MFGNSKAVETSERSLPFPVPSLPPSHVSSVSTSTAKTWPTIKRSDHDFSGAALRSFVRSFARHSGVKCSRLEGGDGDGGDGLVWGRRCSRSRCQPAIIKRRHCRRESIHPCDPSIITKSEEEAKELLQNADFKVCLSVVLRAIEKKRRSRKAFDLDQSLQAQ